MLGLSNSTLFVFMIGLIAVVFLQAGIVRIHEGFKAGEAGVRCGVDLPTCSGGTQCLNGFCQRMDIPPLQTNQLPVYP
jgi:hypothetical protein